MPSTSTQTISNMQPRTALIVALVMGFIVSFWNFVNSSSEIEKLNSKITNLETRFQKLQSEYLIQKLSGPKDTVEFEYPDEKRYQSIKTHAGPVLVILDGVRTEPDETTISMLIGNPTAAGFSGFKAKVQWGRKFDVNEASEYNKLSSQNIEISDYLPAGSWTTVRFKVAPTEPDQIRRIIFTPLFDGVHLPGLKPKIPRVEPTTVGENVFAPIIFAA